jgi:Domain of unknown function (DUF4338)/Transposase Tn5 dimerisation domain/Transposase DNA-binding
VLDTALAMGHPSPVRIAGRELPPEVLQELQQRAADCSRRGLAIQLCEQAGWQSPTGQPALMTARKVLAELARQRLLAPPLYRPPARARPPEALVCPEVVGPLEALQPLEIILVPAGPSALSTQWRQLLHYHHYLKAGPLCGAQLRYLVRSAQGPVAALAFSAAARQVAGRDTWIGWDRQTRRQNLHLVINNSRFLVLGDIANLASHVLSRVLERLALDWQQRYGYRPVLVETFVDRQHLCGGCYRAANWQAIGLTQGRGRQDGRHKSVGTKKILWVYPLAKNFRQVLGQLPATLRLAPPPDPKPAPPPPPPVDWAEEELGRASLGDRRLVQRACQLARAFWARPQAALPQACGTRANTKAAYRFLDNPRVTMKGLLSSHVEATTRRMAHEKVVLAVQDTTSLNYSTHPATEMLGLIGSQAEGLIGMHVHSTLAFNLAGTPLGLVDVQCWTRCPEEFGKKHQRYHLPMEAKESVRWLRSLEQLEGLQKQCPQTQLISVGDSEADIYELFVWAKEKPGRPSLLVRATRERLLEESQEHLIHYVDGLPVAGHLELRVPRREGRAARTATLSVRFGQVELCAPQRKADLPSVRLWVVSSMEEHPPPGVEPLRWDLLTTCPVQDLEGALEKLQWYTGRWGIEVFHRVLKSGCQIETRQLAGADRLEACLAIDMVVAWRIFHLTKLGRETPEVPCTVFFEENEWKALVVFVNKNPKLPEQAPNLRTAIHMVAGLGGFLGRKSDGDPGTQTLWLGLQRLDDIAEIYRVLSANLPSLIAVSSNKDYG